MDYGDGNLNTIFHYNDYLVPPRIVRRDYPWRSAGKFFFKAADGNNYFCSAALIANGIVLTAGHCVHEGGSQSSGWIQSGYFVPGFSPSNPLGRFGYCEVRTVATTSGWYNQGNLDQGYDVGLIACTKRILGSIRSAGWLGRAIGTVGFCVSDCRQQYWFLTQLGYPGNYYSGDHMTTSQHIETTKDNSDYVYGSGMRGGSSGGPHVSNIGFMSDSASSGQWSFRNVIFAVTSWGYIDDTIKIQGASPLSGVENGNNFKTMFNNLCDWAKTNVGYRACNNV